MLELFEPFGMGNQKPVFASIKLRVDDIKTVGSGKHLKLKLSGIDAIAFSKGELASKIHPGDYIDVAYNLEINRFNGKESAQLKIKDIQI